MDICPEEYRPTIEEPYMNLRQLSFFRDRLIEWRKQVQREFDGSTLRVREEKVRGADPIDQGASEASLQIRSRERTLKLLLQFDAALERIEDGIYGYCAETGEEIGLKRLEARPLATLIRGSSGKAREDGAHAETFEALKDYLTLSETELY